MTDQAGSQAVLDSEHLRLLSLGYLVGAGVSGYYTLIGAVSVPIGVLAGILAATADRAPHPESQPPWFVAVVLLGTGLLYLVVGGTLTFLRWRTSRFLKQRRSLMFCQVVAGITCLEVPYGTVLGILTFIVLGRASVRRLFEGESLEVSA